GRRARLGGATKDAPRYTPLAAQRAVSQREPDDARGARDAAGGKVEVGRAAVQTATLDLGYTRVYSPIDGLVGTTQVKPGNFVGRGTATLLTTVSQIDPMLFGVAITEADYLRVVRRLPPERLRSQPQTSGIELVLADGSVYAEKGRVYAIERAVDPATGTLGIQLSFPNRQSLLRPGQYGKARVLLDMKANALLVPQRAVQELQNLYSVAV